MTSSPDAWARFYEPGSPQTSIGGVQWPGWAQETREGGTYVVAAVRASGDGDPWLLAPNVATGFLELSYGDVMVDQAGHAAPTMAPAGPPLIAVALVGATNRIYRLRTAAGPGAEPQYWRCSESQLDHRGRALMATFAALYKREATLLTFLDTYIPDPEEPTS